MAFQYDKLLQKIKIVCGTNEAFARKMNMTASTMCLKLNGKGFFKQQEIKAACEILNIDASEIGAYFFESAV